MKKVAYCLYLIIAISIAIVTPTRVWAETRTVTDVINEITFAIPESPTAEDWDEAVERAKKGYNGNEDSIDQIYWLVLEMENCRIEAENSPLNILLGIGIREEIEKSENLINKCVEAFEAKTGAKLVIKRTNSYFEVRSRELVLGELVTVKKYDDTDGRYFESAWNGGSGRFGTIGNTYLSENDMVVPIKVAYLNEKNEVVEVVSEPGVSIDSKRISMVLIQKGGTVLGWIPPYNIQ